MYCISKVDLIMIIQLKIYYLFSKDSKKMVEIIERAKIWHA